MTDWQLGIDFGTSYTVAAVAQGSNVTVIDVEANGRSRMPSSVFLNQDGRVLVGTAAQHQASFAPERYEATPKRLLGEGQLLLGDQLIDVTELAAAVIRRVYSEASLQQGETAPSVVRVTHPVIWAETRLDLLREVVERAGISDYEFIPEPVAAAARIGLLTTSRGQTVAVYDLGGGTFDAAVLRRTSGGFEVAGRPEGLDPLGGEDIDQLIIGHLSEVLASGFEDEWNSLLRPPDAGWRRRAMELREEVQRAKETLSDATVCQLWIPGLERDAQLTRDELNGLIKADIESTLDTFQNALDSSNVRVEDLAGIYLVGGSSRIPLVADSIFARFKKMPTVQENPKSIVAMGAAGWDILASAVRSDTRSMATITMTVPETETTIEVAIAPSPSQSATVPGVEAPGVFDSRLVMATGVDSWSGGCTCVAEIELDRRAPPPLTVRARDEPARYPSTAEQARQIGELRAARTPGFAESGVWSVPVLEDQGVERRFRMLSGGTPVEMFEQYLVDNGRTFVLASPETSRELAGSVSLRPNTLAPGSSFESRFRVPIPIGWTVTERITCRRQGTDHVVRAECTTLPAYIGAEEWRRRMTDELTSGRTGAAVASVVVGPVLNRFEGDITTVVWTRQGVQMLSKRGVATSGGFGYMVTINLAQTDQAIFSSLARQARTTGI